MGTNCAKRRSGFGKALLCSTPRPLLLAFLLLAGLALPHGAWAATTYYVTIDGSDATGSGSAALPWLTISNALRQSANGDTVLVSNGNYTLAEQLVLTNGITLSSYANDPATTIIDGNNSAGKATTNRCLLVSNMANAFISGLTFTNGEANDTTSIANQGGGGLLILTNATVSNCVFAYNKLSGASISARGSGIHAERNVLVANCRFQTNIQANGNALGCGISTRYNATVRDCTFIGNDCPPTGSSGGGMGVYMSDGGLIERCTFTANRGYNGTVKIGNGGTLADSTLLNNTNSEGNINISGAGTAVITNCVIASNRCSYSSGIYTTGGIRLENCTIKDNITTLTGTVAMVAAAGIRVKPSGTAMTTIRNCQIINNASTNANLNYYCGSVFILSNAVLENCLISGNTGGGIATSTNAVNVAVSSCTIVSNTRFGVLIDTHLGNGIAVTNSVIYLNTLDISNRVDAATNDFWYTCASNSLPAAQGNITNNPQFADISTNNYRLAAGSICINRGTNLPWMLNNVDLDGKKRIMKKTVDIGAYEAWPPKGTVFSGR